MKPEAKFQQEIVRSLIATGCHPVEIPDDSKKQYRFGQKVSASAKPYDLGVLDILGTYQAFELKHSDGLTWSFAKLETSEHNGLEAVSKRFRPAWIVVLFRGRIGPLQQKSLKTEAKWLDTAKAFEWTWMDRMESAGMKSFDLTDLECMTNCINLPRFNHQQETLWDLTPLGLNLHELNVSLLNDL